MKRSMFCLLTICFSIIAVAIFSSSVMAQGNGNGNGNGNGGNDPPPPVSPFQYRIEYGYVPTGQRFRVNEVAELSDGIIVVGWYELNDEIRGFIYDQANANFIDMPELLGLGGEWVRSSCVGISENGIVVGSVRDVNGVNHGYWFDLFSNSPSLSLLAQQFPVVYDDNHNASRVNADGDIVLRSGFVANPFTGDLYTLPASMASPWAINDAGIVIGGDSSGGTVRYDVNAPGSEEVFSEFGNADDINNLGEFCGRYDDWYRRNKVNRFAYRYGNQLDWLSDPLKVWSAKSLNDSGDVVGQTQDYPAGGYFHYSATSQTFLLKSLVDDDFFDAAALVQIYVTNRNVSLSPAAPMIVGEAEGADGDERLFFLIPE